jgi:hypothetical protein
MTPSGPGTQPGPLPTPRSLATTYVEYRYHQGLRAREGHLSVEPAVDLGTMSYVGASAIVWSGRCSIEMFLA